ncbi:MATE efflux family protein [Arcobacter nitrofigilis DSM 7299]|uniref:MATE efflux family protein n=1 Tax=Arcobacter nitrofigilis (strain ATCC 33309 / DSM 7299 / CCUG 15893 / LMG 7604 / NCTC 12251 / CI) TaxID=572480 RepID=D5V4A0_ARCNC|nr:MATE family efflux transporter [Arcobacter nitrofigilis]ADG91833.1 MATE efflux family protein [Arcobacter nitrofigilis DSM 7299]
MNKTQYLIEEPIPKLIKELAIPASTGMFFNTMYNVVDTFYAGLISTEAIAALSLSFMIYFLITGFGYGFSSAISALIGNSFGKKKNHLASIYAHKGIGFLIILGVIFSIIGYFASPMLFKLLGATDAYLDICLKYINVILFGTIFFMANFALNAILVSKGDTKTYRNSLIFGFFANLALNPLFMYGFWIIPEMGIGGIAFATILVQFINMFYMLYKVLQTKIIHFDRLEYYLPNLRVYKAFFKQGIPSSLNMLTMAFGSIILTYYVTQYGYKAVAGYGIGFRVEQLMLLPALGLSTAVLSLVSNNYGAKQFNRVKEIVMLSLKYGFMISTFGIIFLYVFGKLIVAQFDDDTAVIQYGFNYLLVEVWIFYAYIILFICVSTLQAIKQPKMIFYIGIYRQLIAKAIVSYIIVSYFKLDYIYLFVGMLLMIYSAAIFAYFYTMYKLRVLCNIRV